MTSDEARARFDAAIDMELGEAEQEAFELALEEDPALAAEFARHQAVLAQTHAVGREVESVDLLRGVQDKLRARSGGRFYRDRFAARRSAVGPWVMVGASAVLVLLALGWLVFQAGLFSR